MPWAVTASRLALILRRLRGRFGISARQVAVRTHVPWYLRTLAVVGVVVLAAGLAGWAYDAGRLIAGFDRSRTNDTLDELHAANTKLEEESVRLRSLLAASESNLQIEQAVQRQLAERNNLLAAENVRLKEDIAVFERLAKLENRADKDVSLDRFKVEPDGVPGRYRYSFLIALQGAKRGKDARFSLQLIIGSRGGDGGQKITLPRQGETDTSAYRVELKNFRRIEGKFDVPSAFIVGSVEVRILEGSTLKTSQHLVL